MKTLVARSFSTKEYTLEQIKEIMEQERNAAMARQSIQRIDEMMKQLDQEKPRKIKVRNQGGQLS
jgi:DNA-binding transcriptional MerR regulator